MYVFQNADFVVIKDIRPASLHHYLVIPKHHIPNTKQLDNSHVTLGRISVCTPKNNE